jgi:hypothetical protein
MRQSSFLVSMLSVASVLVAGLGCGAEQQDDPATVISSALTNADVLGFETATGWSTTGGTLAASTTRVQGSFSLSVSNLPGGAQLTSAALSTLSSVGPTLSIQIRLPTSQPNPYWFGSVQLSVNAPSRGVYSVYLGQKDLTGLPLGSFQRLDFAVPASVVTALGSGAYSDLRFTIGLNVPSPGPYLLDDLRFGGGGDGGGGTNARKVRVVYLIPTDKTLQTAYVANLATAARHLQGFFSSKLANETYSLTNPIVTVLNSTHNSAFFNDGSFHGNVINDVQSLTGVDVLNDPDNRWLLYIDAQNACGNGTGASGSLATFPANDLRGLAQQPVIDPCSGGQDFSGRCRWVGGMGHELGHTLGLPHPPQCEDADPNTICPDFALMWIGYTTYPDAFFTAPDLTTLNASPFLQVENISFPPDCSVVAP